MPAVYRCTRSTAARMSSIRRRQSLGGTDRLGNDPRPQLALDRILHDQIDWSAEDGYVRQLARRAELVDRGRGDAKLRSHIANGQKTLQHRCSKRPAKPCSKRY